MDQRVFGRRGFLTVLASTLIGCRTRGASDPDTRAVLEALREQGQARVIIALVSPGAEPGAAGAEATRAAIARMQDDVIASLDPADFRPGARYTSVAALAGVLLSERGFRRLRAHPFVSGVSLDTGGSGHS
jgi:hypothetical protein